MMLIPAIPRQPAADLLAYAQEAVTIGRSLIAEGGRQDGDLRLPTLRHPRTPSKNRPHSFLSRGRTMRQVAGRSTYPGRSRRVLIAHRPKHASQRQDRGRKRKKLQGVRSCKIDISSLRTTASNAAQFTTCCPICCGQPEAKDVRTIVNFVMAVTARVAEPGTCLALLSQIGGFEMGNEASPGLSIEDRKQIAGGLFFIDDTSVREPAFADQLQNVDNHIIEWTSRVRQRAATGAALLTFAGPCRS